MLYRPIPNASSTTGPGDKKVHRRMPNGVRVLLILTMAGFLGTDAAYALQGATGIHDPSPIIKRNGTYHIWATGNQIYHLTSPDLITWSVAPTVFPTGQWPGW